MKKIFTLILALMAFVVGSQTARATLTQPLEVTMKSGMNLNPEVNERAYYALGALVKSNQLEVSYSDNTKLYMYSSATTHKVLLTMTSDLIVTVSADVTPDDDISYSITDADREIFKEDEEAYVFMVPYSSIMMHFVAGSGGGTDLQTMEVTVESGINFYDEENKDVRFALTLLFNLGQLSFTETQQIVSTKTGKVLLTLSEEGIIVVSSDVTSDDDIFYTFTDADREYFKEEDIEEEMEPYAAIKVHFVAGSGGGGFAALSATLKNGMSFDDGENTWMAIVFLYQYFNQIKMEYELNEEGEFTGKVLWLSKDNKLLFFQVEEGSVITIADGVTSADDIIYTITQEDRDRLMEEDPEAYTYLAPYKTVELHFDTSGGGGNADLLTYEGTLKSGMNLYAQENNQLNLAINALVATDYLTEFFNSGHSSPHHDEEMSLIMSLMYFLTETNKHLFSVSPEGIVTLSDELSAADDISYVITEADRTIFEEKGYAEDLAPYGTIKIHFGTGGDGIQPTGIELNKSTLRFTSVGQAHHLIATVYPSDATQSVTWKSDNTQVAIVDEKGLITVTGFGETTIHASTANNLVADCQVSVKQFIGGDLGTQGTWRFEDGVLTVDYNGQMPWNCTSKTTDPEVAYRLKWIDLLSQIKEIVITGKDVEIQPYFLFYSGDGDLGQHPDDHVRTLTLGSGVKKVGKQALTLYDLKRVNVYSIDPPVLASDLGESNCFWKRRIQDNLAFLYLPANAGIGYAMINSEWAYFNHSTNHLDMADNPVGIDEMKSEELRMKNEGAWYTLDGRQVVNGKLPRCIYINNGKKVVVK